MKLYTRTGDDGRTGLFGGDRVEKDAPRVEAYGAVDELNATLALAAVVCDGSIEIHARYAELFTSIQTHLFQLGADLATPANSEHEDKIARMTAEHVAELETTIDEIDGQNTEMKSFILPGGTELAARLHVARAVCRRAERRVLTLGRAEPINEHILVCLNRLGDLLFAMARLANRSAGVEDVPWTPGI